MFDTPFRLPRESDKEDVYHSTREYTIGRRSVDEFLGREPSARERYRGPPPYYPRFIPAPERRIEPENDARRDEDIRREKEMASLKQQLIHKRQQEQKDAAIASLTRQVDRERQNQEHDAERKKADKEQIMKQRQEQEELDKKEVEKYLAEQKEKKQNNGHHDVLPAKHVEIKKEVRDETTAADLTIIQHENKLQYKETLEDICCSAIKYLVPQIPNMLKIFRSKKLNDNGNNGFKKVKLTIISIPDAVVLE